MQWAEVDETVWTIPPERRKTADENRVPILPMAKAVIEQAKVFSVDCDHVFRSSYKPEKPMTRHALTRAVSRHWSEMKIEENSPLMTCGGPYEPDWQN
jgi:integrase